MTTTTESARKLAVGGSAADGPLDAMDATRGGIDDTAETGQLPIRSSDPSIDEPDPRDSARRKIEGDSGARRSDYTSDVPPPYDSSPYAESGVRVDARHGDDEGDTWIGRSLAGRFTVLGRVGMGSMGTVYRATQDAMARQVAVKILRPERALDDQAKARFLREARTTSLLTSPHTVTVFDFGESESGELYLAMELLEGESLGQRLSRVGRLPYREAVDACRQALRSLGEAHGKGIVHRDLKPDNLFFAQVHAQGEDSGEILKVLDFGIAKMLRGDNHKALNAVETQAGTVFGTPRYMSPEQAQGKQLDARSDLYSLGVILYHMLTGAPPFTDDDAIMVMARHIKTEPVRPRVACPEADIPAEIEAVVRRALSKDHESRPASAEEFSQELQRALDASQAAESGKRATHAAAPTRRTWVWIVGGIVLGMVAVAVYWWAMPHQPKVISTTGVSTPKILPETPPALAPARASAPAAELEPSTPTAATEPNEPSEPNTNGSKSGSRHGHATKNAPAAGASASKPSAPSTAPSGYGIFEN